MLILKSTDGVTCIESRKLCNLHSADPKNGIGIKEKQLSLSFATVANKLDINIEMLVYKVIFCCLSYTKLKSGYKKSREESRLLDFHEVWYKVFICTVL